MMNTSKYERWYDAIVERAKNRILADYAEEHHIKPKSIYGEGPTVMLTGREHFLVHWLLTKTTTGEARKKMQYAFNCMTTTRGYRTSIQYQAARKALSEALTSDEERGRRISMTKKGKAFSEEHKAALRVAAENRKPQSEESKLKRSESLRRAWADGKISGMRGKKWSDLHTEEQRAAKSAKISAALTGKTHTGESRAKISAAQTGKKRAPHSPETKAKMAEARRLYWERKNLPA